ncbi:N-acetylmuramoyl-L-alanine amidase [Novosphingobium sp. 9U]|uniref:peptidoglycan recognition protein family protein n=1 Tax=Novosphingobium sp. 9U TaxID=2653158 RepID=UPI0012F28F1A|nr:N-acetylmuramoyl-L-alanine amidase [Novosphingobium sp. 9U]VWX54612.1 conserved hypothetical protein [Novosphingobium sp. 9U]
MVYSLTWLPDVLLKANLKVAEVPEWRTRGRAEMGRVRGVMVHHTVGLPEGNMPSLDLLARGRSGLPGPLSQLGLGRDGTYYVIAAGRANHAGEGVWRGVATGNSSFIGIEAENTGKREDVWPQVQLDALRRGVAAILAHIGSDASMVCGHKEFATPPGRKIDPLFDMPPFREAVAALLAAGVPPAPAIPAIDLVSRPTLRRGATGDLVRTLQAALGVTPTTGNFGPVTEATLRRFQRQHGLVPDGIAGPKTWAQIDRAAPTVPSLVAPAVAPVLPAIGMAEIPIADDAQHPVTRQSDRLVAPNGRGFASKFRLGFVTNGQTSARAYLAANPAAGEGVSASALRCVCAVTGNEGGLEAVNSWDLAFMSFGIMQWTVGVGSDPGELAALLARLKRDDPGAFIDCFSRFGLDVTADTGSTTGRLTLGGRTMADSASKKPLRSPEWAYRFWRAGHHSAVRRCQLQHAAARVARFADVPLRGHPLRQWVTSELGMAHLLDQHVNRPGHVPKTLEQALGALIAAGRVEPDPARWNGVDEQRLIDRYLTLRAKTSMTHSQQRATRIMDQARDGLLKAGRESFV